jgi:hypothetical protein
VTSGESNFESAKGSPALEPTELRESPAYKRTRLEEELNPLIESLDEGRPRYDIEPERAALAEEPTHYLLENPENKLDLDPLVESSYFTEPRLNQPLYSPIKNLFSAIQTFNQPLPIHTITMAQPTNGPKELNPRLSMAIKTISKTFYRWLEFTWTLITKPTTTTSEKLPLYSRS